MAVRRGEPYEPTVAHLPWEVKRAEREATRAVDAMLRGSGLTKSQFGVLQAIAHMRKASSAELARMIFVTPQAMVGLVTTLEEKGFIERSQSSYSARVIEARLTPAGRAVYKRGAAALEQIDRTLEAEFSADEVVRFSKLLSRLTGRLEDVTRSARGPR